MVSKILPLALFYLLGVIQTVNACRVPKDYLQPSNYELTKMADAIVLAHVTGFVQPQEDAIGRVQFNVVKVLKGVFNNKTFEDEGYDSFQGKGSPEDFSKPRPGALIGTCIAKDYRNSHLYLLFLKKGVNGWRVSGPAFTRVNEEVTDESDPWVQAVTHYIKISKLRNYEKEKAALNELRSSSDHVAALIADIDLHFSLPSGNKTVEDLMAIYDSDPDMREKVIAALQKVGCKRE